MNVAASSRSRLPKGEPMNARAQAKKEQIIARLGDVRGRILTVAISLPLEKHNEVFLGTWSVRDLLAHLVGWDFANLEMAHQVLTGSLPGFYAWYDSDWRSYNARLVEKYKLGDLAALVASAWASQRQLIEFLRTISADDFACDRGLRFKGFRVTIASELESEIRDEDKHYQQLAAFSHVQLNPLRDMAV